MDVIQLYNDYGIPYQTEGHKHCRPGWVNTECPFCIGNPGLHLGATLDGKVFYCWRCGIHFPDESISKLLKINLQEARKLIYEYAGISFVPTKPITRKIRAKAFKLPSNTDTLTASHEQYLIKRKFNPSVLKEEWNLSSTGPVSLLDSIDYGHRIIIPIYWEDKQVTFQTRDVTNRHPLKYMACPKDRELIHHKHILYRHPNEKRDVGICVEGVTDVWRLGRIAFATFGIEYTRQQLRLIASLFKTVFVCFDDESQAQIQAKELVYDLRFRGVKAHQITIVGDPGNLPQKEADRLVQNLIS
jgi:hypothetical protein